MKNVKTIGLHIEGALFNEDGTEFTYDDFIKLIESNGIEFCGQTCVITDEGKLLDETGKEIDKDKCTTFKEELDHMIKIKNILFWIIDKIGLLFRVKIKLVEVLCVIEILLQFHRKRITTDINA